ncbi:MAG: NADH-quinone oxidoreductase subunit C [Rickettsiales endosymbiont of Dermacentor nuttalli]
MKLENYLKLLITWLPKDSFENGYINNDLIVLNVKKNFVKEVLLILRDHTEADFKILLDVCGADYPSREKRFDVIYNLLSIKYNIRVIIKVMLRDGEQIESVTDLFSVANWFEREVWDMYGIMFIKHPGLRRILTDYDFEGHPLRKDFPLTGYVELRYDLEQKKVIYESVKLMQEYRKFDFLSPWEKGEYVLPGDGDKKAIK